MLQLNLTYKYMRWWEVCHLLTY